MEYLNNLNAEQKEAVLHTEGPLLILAGAGTGKTRVLTTRIAHILLQKLAFPSQILAVTFTNKAANEMQQRIQKLLGDFYSPLYYVGTFHAINAKILRQHHECIGLKSNFTIIDEKESKSLLQDIIKQMGQDFSTLAVQSLSAAQQQFKAELEQATTRNELIGQVAGFIETWKNLGLAPHQISEEQAASCAYGYGKEIYQRYQDALLRQNNCDFGDLLLRPLQLFQQKPEILEYYQKKFRYIMVDEYQDTNTAQYLWLRLLSQKAAQGSNICCVGDDDQSIYGWRGARVENILSFEKHFPQAKIIYLQKNYRSTAPILATASALISRNQARFEKTLIAHADKPSAPKVTLSRVADDQVEALTIAHTILNLAQNNHKLNDMAILIRSKAQLKKLEDGLRLCNIPHNLVGITSFYSRREIKDICSYLRLIANPADDLAFQRILNTPKRGLGAKTLETVQTIAHRQGITYLEAADFSTKTTLFRDKKRKTLGALVSLLHHWQEKAASATPEELLKDIIEKTKYQEWLETNEQTEAANRLKDLIQDAQNYKDLSDFLEQSSLEMGGPPQKLEENNNAPAVLLLTYHRAKGLEFETVFLPGWEWGIFPLYRNKEEKLSFADDELALTENMPTSLEEERRLAYVGITRAKTNLFISSAKRRMLYGQIVENEPSIFWNELPPTWLEISSLEQYGHKIIRPSFHNAAPLSSGHALQKDGKAHLFDTPSILPEKFQQSLRGKIFTGQNFLQQTNSTQRPVAPKAGNTTFPLNGKEEPSFVINQRIFHNKFGYGYILEINHDKLRIFFEKAGEKNVLKNFVQKI